MRHKIKEQKERYQDAELEVSLFDGKIFTAYADVSLPLIQIKLVDNLFD